MNHPRPGRIGCPVHGAVTSTSTFRSGMVRYGPISFAISLAYECGAHAQYGGVDPTFNPADDGAFGDGFYLQSSADWDNPYVLAIAPLPDGRILAGGQFKAYNQTAAHGLIRLFPNGSVDPSFIPDTGLNGSVRTIVPLPDGRILAGGGFQSFHGQPHGNLVRLLPDGSPDASFQTGTGANGTVFEIALQEDGGIIVVGGFTHFNGTPRKGIVRLMPDGSLDHSFDPGSGANGAVHTVSILQNGGLLVGGAFSTFNTVIRNNLARLQADGSLDTSFDLGTGPGALHMIRKIQQDAAGRIVIAGDFHIFGGLPRNHLVRLLPDGSMDDNFQSGAGPDGSVIALLVLPDGVSFISGSFVAYDGTPVLRLARVHPNGTLDTGFSIPYQGQDPSSGAIFALATVQQGAILAGGNFHTVGNRVRKSIARLTLSGGVDEGFNPARGPRRAVHAMAMLPDGRIVLGGRLWTYNDMPSRRLAMLGPDGLPDPAFQVGRGPDSIVWAVTPRPDGRILIGGWFSSYDGHFASRVACIDPNGAFHPGFSVGDGPNGHVWVIAPLPDGRAYIAGGFQSFDGQPRSRIARVMPDGSLDAGFVPAMVDGEIYRLAAYPDGRVIITGGFETIGGATRKRIARLLPNGALDEGFNGGEGPDADITDVVLRADGRIVVSGGFNSFDGMEQRGLAVLEAFGAPSTPLNTGEGVDDGASIGRLALLPGDRIVAVGDFTSFHGVPRRSVVRLLADGTVDGTFDPGDGPWGWFNTGLSFVAADAQDRYVIHGEFIRFNGVPRHRMVRLFGSTSVGMDDPLTYTTLPLFPNPTSDILHFGRNLTGAVHDVQGRMVMRVPLGDRIGVHALAPGVYLLRTDEGQVMRFVLE